MAEEATIALLRALGARRRRRRAPKMLEPTWIRRSYARFLLDLSERIERSLDPLMRALPGLAEGVRQDVSNSEIRNDADEGRTARELIERARQRFEESFDTGRRLESFLARIASQANDWNRQEMRKQMRAAFGVDVFAAEPQLRGVVDGFVSENVSLIKSLPSSTFDEVEKIVTRGLANATHNREIAKEIQSRFGVTRNKARLIARDQIGKINGNINKARQKSIGVKRYVWRTVNDRRVRGTPGGAFPNARYSHFNREGVVFSWDEPPPDGHPGHPVQCRCYSEPVLDDLVGEELPRAAIARDAVRGARR